MSQVEAIPGYFHKQRAPLCLILYGAALFSIVLAVLIGDPLGGVITAAATLPVLLLAPTFHYLAVEDRGDRLAIHFGPLPVFRTKLVYDDIEHVVIGRTLFLDGWGIHYSLRGGVVWNIWGRDCVVVKQQNGRVLRIGTDDAENLVQFLESKMHGTRPS